MLPKLVPQEWVYYSRLSDDDEDLPDRILALGGAVGRWNPAILGGSGVKQAR